MSTLVPKKSRDDVYRFLFTEGVLACPKYHRNKWSAQLGGKRVEVPVIQVMYLMRQLKSRGLIKEQFAWRHFYWFLNDTGVEFLRKYLHLADNVVPNTQRKPDKEENFERRPERSGDGEGRGRGRGGRGGRGRGDGSGRGGRGGRGGFRDREGGAEGGEGRGRGRGGRGGFRSDRRDYHSDPAAGTTGAGAGAGDNNNAASSGDQPIARPRGRGRGAPTTGTA